MYFAKQLRKIRFELFIISGKDINLTFFLKLIPLHKLLSSQLLALNLNVTTSSMVMIFLYYILKGAINILI